MRVAATAGDPPEDATAATKTAPSARLWFAGIVVVLVALAAWRSSFGISFADDGYYAAATLRLAQGAHVLSDEMFLQSLGFLVAVPFAKLWTALFGTSGIVLALRCFYVLLAAGAGVLVYRALRPSFGAWACLAAVSAPLLAPPYGLLAVSYDTMAALGLIVGASLAFAAVRDSSKASGVGAGLALAFAAVSYAPLIVVAVVALVTVAIVGRGRGVTLPVAAGGGAFAVVFAAWLLTQASVADMLRTLHYMTAIGQVRSPTPFARLAHVAGQMSLVMLKGARFPLWLWFVPAALLCLAGVVAGARRLSTSRRRSLLLAAVPIALVLPAVAGWRASGYQVAGWTLGANYLIATVLFILPIALVRAWREGRADERLLLAVTLPMSLTAFAIVEYFTAAGQYWGSAFVGLAPLAMACIAIWARSVGEALGPLGERIAAATIIAILAVLLVGVSFKDAAPWGPTRTFSAGPLAGITTSRPNADRIAAAQALFSTWVRPGEGVLFVASPLSYVLQPGVMVTNAVWLNRGPSDQATIDYYGRTGRAPDVAFALSSDVAANAGQGSGGARDPLLDWLASGYRVVDVAGGFTVYARR